jgi:hypothetical protein
MKNVSVKLTGGPLDGQTYTAREEETILYIHNSDVKHVVNGTKVNQQREDLPEGHLYVYEQESEGSNRFVYVKTEM